MEKKHRQTLLTTMRVHLERNKEGSIKWVFDPNGQWEIVAPHNRGGLSSYFTPQYVGGFDKYGSPIDENNSLPKV